MNALQIRLLGEFSMVYNGKLITTINRARLQSALAFLVLHSHAPQLRRHMAFQLWPDSTERQAQNNLRKLLHQLRTALAKFADDWLYIDGQTVHWQPDIAWSVDAVDFETNVCLAEDMADNPEVQLRMLAKAVALYRGDLLPSCYDEWITSQRGRLHNLLIESLERLIQLAEEQRNYPTAVHYAQQLLQYDPLHEVAYRRLIRLYMLEGNRASALHIYHTCAVLLQRELGVEPGLETQQLHAQILELDAPTTARSRSQRAETGTLRLVGRQAEWQMLRATWRRATRGQPSFVLISGEAGLGKTRLAEELLTWADRQGIANARTRTYAAGQGLAYAPMIEWLQSKPLQASLTELDEARLAEVARLLPDLLPTCPDPAVVTPSIAGELSQWQRQRLFATLTHLFLDNREPKLLLIDDLQWCDGETLAWIRYLFNYIERGGDPQPQSPRMLVVGTVRPEEVDADHPLTELLLELRVANQVTEIALMPLTLHETANVATQLTDSVLDAAAIQHIFNQTEGNPLFIVEMVRAGLATTAVDGEGNLGAQQTDTLQSSNLLILPSPITLPPKILAFIQSRLIRLSSGAHQLASIAAVIGRSFSFELLQAVSEEDERVLVNLLDELWRRGIVRTHGGQTYDFSHDRIREVAYGEISPVQRPVIHRRVAQALEHIFAGNLDPWSSQLAAHYEQAGLIEEAITYFARAADVAHNLFACNDAVALLHRALALLETLPVTDNKKERELSLLLQLAKSLEVAQGYLAPELFANAKRVLQLVEELGEPRQHYRSLISAQGILFLRAQFSQVLSYADQMEALIKGQKLEPVLTEDEYRHLVAETHRRRGNVFWLTGQLNAAQTEFELAMSLHYRFVGLWSFGALNTWLLGFPDRARQQIYRGLQIAQENDDPLDKVFVTANLARLNHLLRRLPNMKLWANRTVILGETYQLPFWLALGMLFQGRALAEEGQVRQRIEQISAILDRHKGEGHLTFRTHFLSLLAEAYAVADDFNAAVTTLNEATALSKQTGEQFWLAELMRLRGDYLLAQSIDDDEVESCYQQAITIAQQQNAKSLELRATMSLAHLWCQQNRVAEAHSRLSTIYNWFTEGFHTPDLRAARTLLAEFS